LPLKCGQAAAVLRTVTGAAVPLCNPCRDRTRREPQFAENVARCACRGFTLPGAVAHLGAMREARA
jgi:hypothetical protein